MAENSQFKLTCCSLYSSACRTSWRSLWLLRAVPFPGRQAARRSDRWSPVHRAARVTGAARWRRRPRSRLHRSRRHWRRKRRRYWRPRGARRTSRRWRAPQARHLRPGGDRMIEPGGQMSDD